MIRNIENILQTKKKKNLKQNKQKINGENNLFSENTIKSYLL